MKIVIENWVASRDSVEDGKRSERLQTSRTAGNIEKVLVAVRCVNEIQSPDEVKSASQVELRYPTTFGTVTLQKRIDG
ncbi:hypothetical protein TNCV_1703401 [Trichonephila clavipes]|nr:hypothetical protein TNCV_1703401 [Trichonephila clavipes]